MRMQIDIQDPIPPWINNTWQPFDYYKFGLCCWVYSGGYSGEIEWINSKHFCTEPKFGDPQAFRYCFQKGIIATVTPVIQITANVQDTIINGTNYNLVKGTNLTKLIGTL